MPLSHDEVRSAWRALVDEPVPDDMLLNQLCALPSLTVLRRMVMETHAFQVQLPHTVAKVPATAPPLSVETSADPATLAALLALVERKWRQLGAERPHWSVTGKDEFLPERISENQIAFEASGRADLDLLLAVLLRNRLPAERFTHVCDFGCGVGRVSLPLAGRFPRITACDVSEEHLGHGRAIAARRGLGNISFTLVESPDFGMTEPFDLWFSYLVLQHNPPPIMVTILRRMFALLAPGGVALFQLPTYIMGYRFNCAEYLRSPPVELIECHVLPQQDVLTLAREANCDVLEIREDCSVWPPSEAVSNLMLFQKR
jgi:2-polyprenyl-3-methyl-5-hydroxy-6-metoxy-1,4-benzoquinol methylase